MHRMRQTSGSGQWNNAQVLLTPEEIEADRRVLTARLGLSDFGARSNPDSVYDVGRELPGLSLPMPQSLDPSHSTLAGAGGRSSRSVPSRTRMMSYGRSSMQRSGNLEARGASGDGDLDMFYDCMDLERSPTFSTMFNDLDLEGSEATQNRDETVALVQPDNGPPAPQRGPGYDPVVASTGNSSRGFSCKRKSCNMPSPTSSFQESMSMRHPDASHHGMRSLMLPPPTLGASSSRSAALMEGPRPQKTRLSSDALDSDPVFSTARMPDFTTGSTNVEDGGEASHVFPRSVRRSFPSPEVRVRRVLDFSTNYAHLSSPRDGIPNPSGPGYGHLAAPREGGNPVGSGRRFHGAAAGLAGGQGLSRRIGRISSNRSLSANPSLASQRDQTESRTRSIRMACLENGSFANTSNHGPSIRRNYLPRDARQGFRSALLACSPSGSSASHSMAPPPVPISLMEPEMRQLDSAQTFRPPLQTMARREVSALTEGFMIPPHEFDWERHRPRFMAGGLAEILRALERVERDEDLTREQLMMLEATTFLFGGIGLHDDHSDWRLDIDNMSYEELLALGDRIGTVSTGISEEVITRQLKKSTYTPALTRSKEDSDVKCCVCQEEFEEGAELGIIDCGHNYHKDCIRQWLVRKNSCPICKATALSVPSTS